MDESIVELMGQRRAKASQEIAHVHMALYEGVQAEERERVKRASRGAAGLGQHTRTGQTQSPATTSAGVESAAAHRSLLLKLGSGRMQLDPTRVESNRGSTSGSTSSSDDDADIFPASMAGRVPTPGLSPSSIVVNGKRPTLTSLGGQALQTSQSMIQRAGGQASSPSRPIAQRASQQHSESDVWLKVDVIDKESGVEEEGVRSKLPTGSSVANLILHGPDSKPRRASNQLQGAPSQKGLLNRLERRFSSAGHVQPSTPKSPSSVSGEFANLKGGYANVQATPYGPANESLSAPANLPSIFRPVGAQPFLALSRQSSLKSSISTGTLGDGSPHLQKQPSFARQPMKERSTAPAAAAGAAKHPSKPQVADAMSSVLQGS
mmetsp:Transcript_27329/g.73895  ORF Transcript_27329/g.73895 Transcript_27329/m.73895 type:complete len:378 (+) Transcript_27329:106-1239(+)